MSDNTSEEPKRPRRWPRSEHFELSAAGRVAAQSYLDVIVASRSEEGRKSFDDARGKWATDHRVVPEDGLCFRELVSGPLTLVDLVERLDGLGPARKSLQETLERGLERGLVATVLGPQTGTPPTTW